LNGPKRTMCLLWTTFENHANKPQAVLPDRTWRLGGIMNWKDLRKTVESGNFIEGIYNYCDRWCEKCSFTSRCLLHTQDQAEPEEELDLEDESFWKKLESRLSDTREIVIQAAGELGIDPEELTQAAAQEPEHLMINPDDHPLSRAALDYAKKIEAFFEKGGLVLQETAEDVEQAVEVIRWFQYQIGVKLTSALNSRLEEEEEEEELQGEQKHSDGCAKVALIGIDRSIAGWEVLLNNLSAKPEIIPAFIQQLQSLRRASEDAFPEARSFLRPGFDFIIQ
jgi:hypothetical protein